MDATRASRRHHEARIKSRWRRIVVGWRLRNPIDVERFAVRRAHHNARPCAMCSEAKEQDRRPEYLWRTAADRGEQE